jgi:HEAT repeat protein
MKTSTIRKVALWTVGLALCVAIAAFVFISTRIGADVRSASQLAMAEYGGDRVEALMRYAEDSGHSLRERNRAIWALGQLGDRRALPVLRSHYSGGPCDHAAALCQRELDKAIELADGGFNATALVWRHSMR